MASGPPGEEPIAGRPPWLIMEKERFIANRFSSGFGGLEKQGRGLS